MEPGRNEMRFVNERTSLWSRLLALSIVLAGLSTLACDGAYEPAVGAVRLEPEIAAYKTRAPEAPKRIEQRMLELNVPGASVTVVSDYAIDWALGFGVKDTETREPVTPRTLFQAASISKSLAAVAAMKLVEEGRLALDADINLSLVTWRIPESAFTAETPVTLRHLLSHTGGLTVHGFGGYAQGEPLPTLIQVLDGVPPANSDPVRVVVEPGTSWSYSGGGYTVLQLAIMDISGLDFTVFLKQEILEPLEMGDSSFDQPLPPSALLSAATGHVKNGRPIPGKRHTYPEQAAAGLWTTPTDLAKFLVELQLSLEGRSNWILSREATTLMLTEVRDNYGLGFIVNGEPGEPTWGHTGGNAGLNGYMLASRGGGHGVVVMTNGDRGGPLFREIVQAVRTVYDW
jgi:CubicO group peptidase (beta-lactamase class C family)